MSSAAKTIMDRLQTISDILLQAEEYDQQWNVQALIEIANAAGHTVYTWDKVSDKVRDAVRLHRIDDPRAYDRLTLQQIGDALDKTSKDW